MNACSHLWLCVCMCLCWLLMMPGGWHGVSCCVFALVWVCACNSFCAPSSEHCLCLECVCVCDISFGGLTGWRICAVIVVWLSSCCNWKCLISETFFKMFIAACQLTSTQLFLLADQLPLCSQLGHLICLQCQAGLRKMLAGKKSYTICDLLLWLWETTFILKQLDNYFFI